MLDIEVLRENMDQSSGDSNTDSKVESPAASPSPQTAGGKAKAKVSWQSNKVFA